MRGADSQRWETRGGDIKESGAQLETYNGDEHAWSILSTSEETGQQKDENRYRNCRDSEVKFNFSSVNDNDEELNCETKEEEEIKFEKGNIDLDIESVSSS